MDVKGKMRHKGSMQTKTADKSPASARKRGRPPKLSDAEVVQLKQAILHAAEGEFGIKGFDGASLIAIAKEAGVTQPLIHYHYTNKLELWNAVIRSLFGTLEEKLSELNISEITPQLVQKLEEEIAFDALSQLTWNFIAFSSERPALAQIMFHEMSSPGIRAEFLRTNYVARLENQLRLLTNAATSSSKSKRAFAPLFAMYLGACMSPFLHASYIEAESKLNVHKVAVREEIRQTALKLFV